MAEDSEPTGVRPSEHEPVDADHSDENVAVLMSRPPDPEADNPASKRQQEAQQPGKPPKLDFNWTTALIGILATVAAALSAYFSYLAVNEMKNTNRLMAEQVHTGQQAYVFANSGTLSDAQAGSQPVVTLAAKNYGLTPAREVSVRAQLVITDRPLGDLTYVFEQGAGQAATLGASQEMGVRVARPRPFSEDELVGILNGKLKLYAAGAILFDHMFGGVTLSEFCSVYDPRVRQMVLCDGHNTVHQLTKRPGPNETWSSQNERR